MDDVRVSQIVIYPIKSLGGISVPSAVVEKRGLQYDRRWLVVDSTGRFVTQREFPKLAVTRVSIDDTCCMVEAPGCPSLSFGVDDATGDAILVQIWKSECVAREVSACASAWFSRYLEGSYRLVHMPESTRRRVNPLHGTEEDIVSFADGYPVLIVGQSSLDELNIRLAEPIPMNRFRPNIVVEGSAAFEEDTWQSVAVGNTTFRLVKPCARCIMTTIDQSTAAKGVEPLRTLAQYRIIEGKVLFGQNTIPLSIGAISLHDKLRVLEPK